MANSSENVIGWNFPNVVTIWLMVMLLWVVLGFGSHLFRKKSTTQPGVAANGQGGFTNA